MTLGPGLGMAIAGKRTPLGAFGVGMAQGVAKRKMSEWESDRKRKFEEEKIDMETARGIMDELQGLDFNDILAQEQDPSRRAALQSAADEIDKISEKWADFMDPSSEGGSAITASEAQKLIQMRSRISPEISMLQTGQTQATGRSEIGLETEGAVAKFEALQKLEPQIDGEPLSVAEARAKLSATKAREAYYRAKAASGLKSEKTSVAARELAKANAKILPLYRMKMIEATRQGNTDEAQFYAQQIKQLQEEIMMFDATAGPEGPEEFGAMDALIQEEMSRLGVTAEGS
jgi:hypothetical protein